MYAKRQVSTLDSMEKAANEDDDLPNFMKATFWSLIRDIDRRFEKRKLNLVLIDQVILPGVAGTCWRSGIPMTGQVVILSIFSYEARLDWLDKMLDVSAATS